MRYLILILIFSFGLSHLVLAESSSSDSFFKDGYVKSGFFEEKKPKTEEWFKDGDLTLDVGAPSKPMKKVQTKKDAAIDTSSVFCGSKSQLPSPSVEAKPKSEWDVGESE